MTSPFASFGRAAPGRTGPRSIPQPVSPQASMEAMMPQARNLYKTLSKSGNPAQLLQNMAQNNPRLAPIMGLLRQGKSPESLFREVAAQRGIDPDEFVRRMKDNDGE